MRARARHAKPSQLRTVTLTTGLATAVTVPLMAQPASAHSTGAGSSSASASSSSLLRQGAQGSAVTALQRQLHITADGVFGRQTKAAVVRFQSRKGLVADGVVGPRTRAALSGSSSKATNNRASAVRQAVTASHRVSTSAVRASSTGAAAVREASRHVGKPYVYGASGPNAFDCSGFVQYVYRQVGVSLPRTSGAQAAFARSVSKDAKRPGDLIIISSGGRVSHIAIYAGDNKMWVARRSGTTITKQTIYTSNYRVGRVA